MYLKLIIRMISKLFIISLGIICIGAFIGLFTNQINLSFTQYMKNIIHICGALLNPDQLTITNSFNHTYSMFPAFWEPYFYSIRIFLAALAVTFIVGFLLAFLTSMLPRRLSSLIYKLFTFFESIPDLFILLMIQYITIVYYKKTGILLFDVAGYDEKVFALPIITLSILPTLLLYRVVFMLMEEETVKNYVEFAQSKGFSRNYIMIKHITQNLLYSILNHFKSIILLILSTLIIFERLFNIYGITNFIMNFPEMEVICFSLIMFYIPVFLILTCIALLVKRTTGQEVHV